MTEILLTFATDGSVVIEVLSAEGPECVQKTRDLEQALGHTQNRTLKPEFTTEQNTGKSASVNS